MLQSASKALLTPQETWIVPKSISSPRKHSGWPQVHSVLSHAILVYQKRPKAVKTAWRATYMLLRPPLPLLSSLRTQDQSKYFLASPMSLLY